MLHIGAIHVVPSGFRQTFGSDLSSHLTESDNPQIVTGVLASYQRVEGHRCLLGWQKVASHGHRQRQIEHDDRGSPDLGLVAFHGKIVNHELYRGPGTVSSHCVAESGFDVEVERIPVLPSSGGELAFMARANVVLVVTSHSVLAELSIQISDPIHIYLRQSTR